MTHLVKIRLKVDPKIGEQSDYANYDGYIGFILQEDTEIVRTLETIRIFVPNIQKDIKVSPDHVKCEFDSNTPQIDMFKKYMLNLCYKELKIPVKTLKQLNQCETPEQWENFLLQNCKFTESDLKKLYRNFILNHANKKL